MKAKLKSVKPKEKDKHFERASRRIKPAIFRTSFNLEEKLVDELRIYAAKSKRSMTDIVTQSIREHLSKYDNT